MAEICVFCKEQIESPYPPRLEEGKMFMFEILMEQTSFDKDLLINSPVCDDCDKTITDFFSFKSNFMETEDEFINYMDSNKKVDLYNVLVKTFKLKKFENENVPIRVCRICFKATQLDNYKEIKSLESKLAIMITTCLPEFNIKLTSHTYLCQECYTVILQYYHFLLLCLEATKSKSNMSSYISDPLSRKRPYSEIAEDSLSKLAKERIILEVSDSLSSNKVSLEGTASSSKTKSTLLQVSQPSSKKTAVLKTSDSLLKKRGSSEKASLAVSSGEPKNKKKKVETNVSEEEKSNEANESSVVSSSIFKPFLPARRPRGRPRTKGIVIGPKQETKIDKRHQIQGLSVSTNVHYECQVCPEILHTFQNLQQHIKDHQNDTHFFCWRCGYECYNFGAMYKHFEGHGMHLFKMVDNDGDTAAESSKTSENSKKDTPSAINSTEIDGDLLAVKRTDIYTPPDVKKARKKRGPNKRSLRVNSSTDEKSQDSDKKNTVDKCFQCQICPQIFDSILGWTDHVTFHRNQDSIVCWRCGKWFESLDLLRDHFFEVHFITTFYRLVVPSEVVLSSKGKRKIHSSVTDKDEEKDISSSSSSSLTTTIPCVQCKQVFEHIDSYMDHECKFSSNETLVPEKSVEKQAFNCGHCNTVFYSLDDLDDHNCIPTKSIGDGGGKSADGSIRLSRKPEISQLSTSNSPSQIEPTTKNPYADYECSYCLQTFVSIKGLDNHICQGDLESAAPDNTANTENVALKNTAPVTNCQAVAVKKESLFECSYCVTLFESGLELNQHKCSNAPANTEGIFADTVAVSINTEAIFDNTEDISAVGDGMSRLVKADPEYDNYLSPDACNELGKENCDIVQCDTKVSDGESVSKNPDDVLKSRNVKNQEKLNETPESARMKKKNAINKIANMFGVNIVEGKNGKENENLNKKYNCIGCGFQSIDQKDLMFHFGFCDKVFRCSYCSYRTNISQKLEIHCWAVHNILIFVCPWCTFVTSMEENYDAHILAHQENCSQNDDVQCLSDDAEEQPKSPQSMLNELFNSAKFKDGRAPTSQKVLHVSNQESHDRGQHVAGNGNQTDPVQVTIHKQQGIVTNIRLNETASSNLSNEDTLSADNIWPVDSDDDLDDSETFHIPRADTIGNIEGNRTSEKDPLATEPVWLVKSSAVNENVANRQTDVGVETPEEGGYSYNLSELIIPDRIIPEPTGFKSELQEDPLKEASKLPATDAPKPSNSDKAETVKTKPSRKTSKISPNSTEPIVINCDSDSDSEFVESSDSRISSVAACAGEVVPVSASEASKLISEGIPVISEASLVAMQIEASSKVTEVVAMKVETLPKSSDGTPDTVRRTEEQSNSVLNEQNQENNKNNSLNTVPTDKKIESAKNSKEKGNKPNFTNVDYPQPQSTKESSGKTEETLVDKEKHLMKEDTRKDSNEEEVDISDKDYSTDFTKNKNKIKVTIERQFEDDGSYSDASSFFVTDNEESDREELEESIKKCTTTINKGSAKTLDGVKQKELGSKKIVEKPFLQIVMDEDVVISDDEDDRIEKEAPVQGVVNADAEENKKKTSETQPVNNSSLKPELSGSSPSKTLSPKKSVAVSNFSGNSGKISTVNIEESFVISDDDEDDVPVNENNTSVKDVSVKEKRTPKAIQVLSQAVTSSTEKNVIIKYAKVVPSKNKGSDTKKIDDQPGAGVRKSSLPTCLKNVPVLKPATKDPASLRTYSKVPSNSGVQSTRVTPVTCSRTFSNTTNQNKTTEKKVGVLTGGAAKDTAALATYSKTASNRAKPNNSVKVSTPVQKKVRKPTVLTEDPWMIIDDDGEDILADKEDKDETPAVRSRNDSASSIILDRDFSKETEDETAKETAANDSGDDCVFVSEDSGISTSKNLGPPKITAKVNTSPAEDFTLPPNALNLFITKVKSEIQQKYPNLQWGAQKNIIMDAWRNMSSEDKWPFKEEARLHCLLFKREHPNHPMKRIKKQAGDLQSTPKAKINEKLFRRAVMTYFKTNSLSISGTARRHGLNAKTFQRRLQRLRETKSKDEIMKEMADAYDTDSSDDSLGIIEPVPGPPSQRPPQLEDSEAIVLD